MTSPHKLTPQEYLFGIDHALVEHFDSHSDTGPLIIGQDRAIRALTIGTEIMAKGYNIFVTGLPGTGKQTTVMQILKKFKPRRKLVQDICYVFNFQSSESPAVLYFSPGMGSAFKKDIHQLVEAVKAIIQLKLSSDGFKQERDRMVSMTESAENHILAEFESKLAADGFQVVQVEGEDDAHTADIVPVYKGQAIAFDELQRLVASGEIDEQYWNRTREKYYHYIDAMRATFDDLRIRRANMEAEVETLKRSTLLPEVHAEVEKIRSRYTEKKVHTWLAHLEQDIVSNLYLFQPEMQKEELPFPPLFRYGVNVLVDHKESRKVPVIFESHPDYAALFGSQEMNFDLTGESRTNYLMIRAGALIKASGGFLILRAEDVLSEDGVWNTLKRALQDGKTEIRNQPAPLLGQSILMKPEPVEINTKVIILGSEHYYDLLYNTDEDFPKLFKVPAEFDSVMDRNEKSTQEYVSFIRRIAKEEKLLPVDYSGMASVLEYGVRVAEFRGKLSTRFSLIADLIREADYYARKEKLRTISRAIIQTTINERKFLYSLPEEKIDEQIVSGELVISLSGKAIGRINGLAIMDRGYYSFGRPVVITARTAPGTQGFINIERESGLSGEIHDKGMLIIEGYLQSKYARNFPLSIRASICFEQSYIEVDGDSASSTEVYALLSAIGEFPLRQDLAVTGSVNQMGEIQPVGGVSEKIEGFYEICRKTGLTGTQGVIIPRLNLPNLILTTEVQKALEDGSFHLFAVSTVDECIEILSGLSAGERGPKGYPSGSVNALVENRLREMAEQVKEFGSGD